MGPHGHKPHVLLSVALLLLVSCREGSQPGVSFSCPGQAKLGVYNPDRLNVLGTCRTFRGIVISSDERSDGDTHLLIAPDEGYSSLLNVENVNQGGMVVEIMPGQNLPVPPNGEHVAVFGTWVFDTHNGWNEIHPVWGIRYLDGGQAAFSLPPAEPVYHGGSND